MLGAGAYFLADKAALVVSRYQTASLVSKNQPLPIDSHKLVVAAPNQKTVLRKDIELVFRAPEKIEENVPIALSWEFRNPETKRAVMPDAVMHLIPFHVYAVRSDLKTETFHIHPNFDGDKQEWPMNEMSFPSSGKWYITGQFVKDGVLYDLGSFINVGGANTDSEFESEIIKTVKTNFGAVKLDFEPKKTVKKQPVKMRVIFDPSEGNETLGIQELIRPRRTNLILASERIPFIWNEHGDGSVREISAEAGYAISKPVFEKNAIVFDIMFPESGYWLMRYDRSGFQKPLFFRFFVEEG